MIKVRDVRVKKNCTEREGYYSPFRLDIKKQSGGLLAYIRSSIPSRQLSYGSICDSIQAIPFENNLRQEKWLMISIYRPPSQDSGFFIHSLTKIIDHFATKYDNHLIMRDFNMEPNNRMFKSFFGSNNLTNLIKTNTCLKGKGWSTDIILTNKKYLFKYTSSYETGLSDHHHMIYTMLKSLFINIEPKLLNYGEYKNFSFGSFKEDLSEGLLDCRNSYDEFESAFITALEKHLPKKKKWIRGNNKPHITKPLRQAIMKASKLKNKANKTKLLIDIRNYKKQRNYVVNLNKNAKFEYFSRYDCKDGECFWVNCKPYFSNKHSKADNDIVLNEDGELILKNKEIANTFNDYFGSIVENLNLESWDEDSNSNSVINHRNNVNDIIKKYNNHPKHKDYQEKIQKYQ